MQRFDERAPAKKTVGLRQGKRPRPPHRRPSSRAGRALIIHVLSRHERTVWTVKFGNAFSLLKAETLCSSGTPESMAVN